jgi:hypothetical protein
MPLEIGFHPSQHCARARATKGGLNGWHQPTRMPAYDRKFLFLAAATKDFSGRVVL